MKPLATERGVPDPIAVSARQLVQHVRDQAMFVLDGQGRAASWNEGVESILGWSEQEWIGQPAHVAFTPEDVRSGVPQQQLCTAAATSRADDERWMQRKNGERFFALGTVTRLLDEHGALAGFVKVLRDGTLPRQAQQERERLHEQLRDLTRTQSALQERTAELRAVTDSVHDYAIYTINTEGRIASWHPGAARLKGYSAEEAIGMPFERLFTAEDRRAGLPAHELEQAARHGEYKGDGQRLRKDGSRIEVAVVLTALRGVRGELLGYLKLTQDITERKRLERELEAVLRDTQAARLDAESANHAKDEFLATISHELRTPLSAILGWAHVLERGISDPQTLQHGLLAISRNARTQVKLIEDLLDMNRIATGKLRLDLQRIELGGVIAAAIDAALPAATAKGIGLRTVFGAHTGAVLGDAARLQQVVANLLNNALKFTPAGGQVSVALAQAGAVVQITVADTGSGIEPQFLARLFNRFQQQDASSTRRHGGLGIGLSIVRHLVELHGGTVRAHSLGAERGATFTVSLPSVAAAVPTAGPAGGGAPTAETRLDGMTVLLIDDEADVRAATQHLLRDAGAEVLLAASAEEGLSLLRERHPAVMLSDIGMPVADGYELIRRVRALPASEGGQTPAAAISAYTRPEDRERALRSGFQMHLSKPVAPAALVAALVRLAHGESDAARVAPAV